MDPQLLARLAQPDCYPHRPATVEIVQTHISVVCLAGELVFKLKKPVRLPFLDFSTAELREFYCREELRLNRRLCGPVYRSVVPLCEQDGRIRFGGTGKVLDHAVVMTRLPADRMLDAQIRAGLAGASQVEAVAGVMREFHAQHRIRPQPGEPGDPRQLARFARDNFADTAALAGPLFDAHLHSALAADAERSLVWLLPRLEDRAAHGFAVDGHGDLHARNICLTDPPVVYDCIEFSPALRCGDVATENAFLVMDLRHRGRADLARAYIDAYVAGSSDGEQRELLPPLIRYRAMVRAKVTALVSQDPDVPAADREAAAQSARQHVRLAAASAAEQGGPWLVLACGLPASGKSTVLRRLAAVSGWPLLVSDRIRKELAGFSPTARAPADCYTPAFSDRVYAELQQRAVQALQGGGPVLLDATFHHAARRRAVHELAQAERARSLVLWFDAGDAETRRRLAARPPGVSDADLAVYEQMRGCFEPPGLDEPALRIASVPPDAAVDRILSTLIDGG